MIWCHVSQADEYVELISSFETDAEALMFAYDAEDKGWAKVSTERASHGDRSLKVGFLMSEAEINRGAFAAFFHRILAFLSYIPRSLGISVGGDEEGKLALLGRSLPFDWEGIDALVFEAYNPSGAPLELSLEVKSGLYDWDPTAKLYHTKVMIPPKKWEAVRLSTSAMSDSLHPDGVIHVRMTLSAKGVLYIDNVRFVAATTPVPETKFVRLTWTRDPRTTQTITWQSRAQAGEVRFGSSGGKLLTTVEAKSTPVFTWSHGVFHEATLTGLTSDTAYDYQIRSGDARWTERRTFHTAPASDEAVFTFLAGSDTKGGRDVIIQLLKLFQEDAPRFMVYFGDAPHTGGLAPHWERWFQAVESFASRLPIMQSLGNHEVGDDPELVNFRVYNALPGYEAYYSFDYGPVHFVCLDTESNLYPEQLGWLEKDLAATNKPWKVVYLHRPLFSSGTVHGSDEDLRNVIGPIFSKFRVNLVFSGHDHLYERSHPINLLHASHAPVGSYRSGTCYVVSGCAGAGLYDAKGGQWWTAALKTKVHHLCRIQVNGSKSMTLEAVDLRGEVFDRVTLMRWIGEH
jgi:3',5'-cyclic AMP phosphodiesterase CpdA